MDRQKLVATAEVLFEKHGLDVRGWRLEFRTLGHMIGFCCSRRRLIALGVFYVDENTEANVLDTLVHEVAHALVGPALGHGPIWKEMAVKLGCNPQACGNTDIVIRPGRYQAACPTCARLFHKYRRPKYIHGYYCPTCGEERGKLAFMVQAVHCASDAVSSARVAACPG